MRIKEHKQVHGEAIKSQKAIDSTHDWGSTAEERHPVLDRNELSKTQTLEEGVAAG